MNIDDNKKILIKRILAGLLALIILGCAVAFSYYLTKGFSGSMEPVATPDNSQFVDSSVEIPDAGKSPSETFVAIAFIAVDIAAVAVILYVLLRKKV